MQRLFARDLDRLCVQQIPINGIKKLHDYLSIGVGKRCVFLNLGVNATLRLLA